MFCRAIGYILRDFPRCGYAHKKRREAQITSVPPVDVKDSPRVLVAVAEDSKADPSRVNLQFGAFAGTILYAAPPSSSDVVELFISSFNALIFD